MAFLPVAVIGSSLISATVGTAVVHWLTSFEDVKRWTWPVWWLGDAMGTLIAAPPVLLWHRLVAARRRRRDIIDAAGFAALGVLLVASQALVPQPIWVLELLKLLMLMLSLAAGARFGLAGPAAITLLIAVGTVLMTAYGTGSFVHGSFYDRLVQAHAFLFATGAGGMLLAAIMADMHRAASRERAAQAALAAASDSRVRMLTMISHDLRTPLGAMTAALEMLRRPAPGDDRGRLIEAGLHAGDTIATLVDDILATASLDRGQITLVAAPFDPRVSIAHVIARHRARADAKGLALTVAIAPAVPELLMGDRVRVEQIVDNLVGNAVAFTASGSVAVECGWADGLELRVTDTGAGIDPALAPFIFDAFVKADPARRGGLGLGLNISRGLAALMGGTITYRPATPRGSDFVVVLPLSAPPADGPEAAIASTADPVDILLIEDDPISREITAAWLKSQGHRVTAVADGAEAITAATRGSFRLVLVDNDLGDGMSGEAVTRTLRALPLPIAGAAIVALTGAADTNAAIGLRASGVDDVLPKPFALTTNVAALVESRSDIRG